ncbi:hypothetical protein [Myceligenerans pegani]|uniref:DUF3800 domain-containing protein n=1 Tax=Myceligenerans pegani TaxID=2776917 RepID=A0ABR9MVN6_9MICO|nr:hypothetical protein [Myceligenerans sp. TRM 65318]MBE1875445.1 hypothetical protein [Myceligenerans sp. TRM 65318]MBE3017716.1 hypothetical protein [Myceligenerans sp. TRM 65318]
MSHLPDSVGLSDDVPRRAHMFVDESKNRGYIIAIAFVASRLVHQVRRDLRKLRASGARSIHFQTTTDQQRKAVVNLIVASGVTSVILESRAAKRSNPRQGCIRTTAAIAIASDARMIILDRDESLETQDRRWLYAELRKTDVRYDHLDRHSEPLLWIADAVAWCWQRGGVWREMVMPAVSQVVQVEP